MRASRTAAGHARATARLACFNSGAIANSYAHADAAACPRHAGRAKTRRGDHRSEKRQGSL